MISHNDTSNIQLSDYGKTFQYKLIANLLTSRDDLIQIFDILDSSLFETSSLIWIVDKLKQHFNEYKNLPDISAFKVYIANDKSIGSSKAAIVDSLKKIFTFKQSTDLEFIQKEAIDFFKYKNFEKTLFNSIDWLEQKKYNEIYSAISEAMVAGTKRDLGLNYNTEVEKRYEEAARTPIPTGWPAVDEYIDGGLSRGEIGVILAMSSTGKSWILQHLSLNALKEGYTVVYYTLEDEQAFVGQRKDSILTGINTHDLKNNLGAVKTMINKKIKGELFIKFFPSEITTMNALDAHLKKLRIAGKEPDLIIIDYGDLLSPLKHFGQDWLNQRQVFAEMKSFAQVQNIPVWTASQANASSKDEYIVQSTGMGRSYQKIAPLSVCLSLQRSLEDRISGVGRLFLAKNKLGKDGITFPCKIDFDRGIFRPMSPNTEEGKKMETQMYHNNTSQNGGEMIKRRVKEKWEKIKANKTT